MNENEFSDAEEDYSEDVHVEEVLSAFTLLENDYKNVLAKMQENENLTEFGNDYTKLFDAYTEAYSNEKDLQNKCQENEDAINELKKIDESNKKASAIDKIHIAELNDKLANACSLTDSAHAREQQAQEIIENMRAQILKLNAEMEFRNRIGSDEDEEMNKTKESFEREKVKMFEEITELKRRHENEVVFIDELQHNNSALVAKEKEQSKKIEDQVLEISKIQQHFNDSQSELNEAKKHIDIKEIELQKLHSYINSIDKQMDKLNRSLKEKINEKDQLHTQNENLKAKEEKSEADYTYQSIILSELEEKLKNQSKIIENNESKIRQMKSEIIKITKQTNQFEKKCEMALNGKYSIEVERDKLRSNIEMMEREMLILKKSQDADKRMIDDLTREKEIFRKNVIRTEGVVKEHIKLIKIQEQYQNKLESDINHLQKQAGIQKIEISTIYKEKNRALEENLDLTQKVEDTMDVVKLKQQSIFEYKKTIAETETKLRQQQNLFETVRADRNAFQKLLQESNAFTEQLKSKLSISNHQTEQLKEDISVKEALLLKDENILKKLNKEKENLKVEVQKGLDQIANLKREIEEMNEKEKRVQKIIKENNATIKKQRNEIELAIKDRDIIGAQLVKRNEEISLLNDKMEIFEITVKRGEEQYGQRLDDIKTMKLEIKRLRQEKQLLCKSISNITDLKNEVFKLERELAEERLKCSALEEELQHPLNIHRWRKLEGTDPDTVDLLQKIQILQKRLLNKTSQELEKDKKLKESERLYLNLRNVLARQPGPDVKTELIKTQRALVMRGSKMKCLIAEINMYESQTTEYKMDYEKLINEFKDVKKKYFKQKKLNQRHLASIRKSAVTENNQVAKFTGGGFKMAPVTN